MTKGQAEMRARGAFGSGARVEVTPKQAHAAACRKYLCYWLDHLTLMVRTFDVPGCMFPVPYPDSYQTRRFTVGVISQGSVMHLGWGWTWEEAFAEAEANPAGKRFQPARPSTSKNAEVPF